MLDLINTTEESHYENYRQQQMETRKFGFVALAVFFPSSPPPPWRELACGGTGAGAETEAFLIRFRSEPKVKKVENPKFKEEEEAVRSVSFAFSFTLRLPPCRKACSASRLLGEISDASRSLRFVPQLRKRFTEQVKMEEARFRQWGSSSIFLS
jgi:septin family protein